jgi:hypothetical protein
VDQQNYRLYLTKFANQNLGCHGYEKITNVKQIQPARVPLVGKSQSLLNLLMAVSGCGCCSRLSLQMELNDRLEKPEDAESLLKLRVGHYT